MQHDPNIAPQHMFDGVLLNEHGFQSPALSTLINQPSPGSGSLNDRQLEPPMTYDQLLNANTQLRTRVSELEVINMMYTEDADNLRREKDEAVKAQEDLKRRISELESQIPHAEGDEHVSKKARLEDSPDNAAAEQPGDA